MKRHNIFKQAGVTIIEVIFVVTLVTVLSAVAIPKFLKMTADAHEAATTAISGALTATNASNYVARTLNSSLGVAVANCTDVVKAMQSGLPNGYSITSNAAGNHTSVACTLSGPSSTMGTFTATGIS